MRILLVDSDPKEARLLTDDLEQAGHEVVAVARARPALALLLDAPFQVVILGRGDADMDGLELCRTLRRFADGRQSYVLMLLGSEDEGLLTSAFEAGIDDYILKPFTPGEVVAGIRRGQRTVKLQAQVAAQTAAQRKQVAKLARLNRRLRSAALLDEPTGLPNRRCAETRLAQAWEAAGSEGSPLSVLMIQVDFGREPPESRDGFLQAIAAELLPLVPRSATLARYRGQALLAILPGADGPQASRLTEKIRATTEALIDRLGRSETIVVRMGVATRCPDTASAIDLRTAADAAVRDSL